MIDDHSDPSRVFLFFEVGRLLEKAELCLKEDSEVEWDLMKAVCRWIVEAKG